MLYPLLFHPIFQERIWGGRNLEKLYRKQLPAGVSIGESWEIVDRPEAQSVIANGPLAGKTLHWLHKNHPRELLGPGFPASERFPLLVKILDAEEKLSLQVHPPAEKAIALGGEPKTEMWYMTHARPGAELYVGLKKKITRATFESCLQRGSVADCFHRVPVKAGDAMFLPSGRVHAIGAGLVIFEVQQNSDTTYRVYDWDRTDASGKKRQLHVPESLESINFDDYEPDPIKARVEKRANDERHTLIEDPCFRVGLIRFPTGAGEVENPLSTALVIGGISGTLHVFAGGVEVELQAGQFCLVPAGAQKVRLRSDGSAEALVAEPGAAVS